MYNINPNQFIDQQVSFDENSDGLIIQRSQEIPDDFLQSLKNEKANSNSVREGDYMRAASIPVSVVEQWVRQGFDFQNADARTILARLRSEHLDYFITTEKTV